MSSASSTSPSTSGHSPVPRGSLHAWPPPSPHTRSHAITLHGAVRMPAAAARPYLYPGRTRDERNEAAAPNAADARDIPQL